MKKAIKSNNTQQSAVQPTVQADAVQLATAMPVMSQPEAFPPVAEWTVDDKAPGDVKDFIKAHYPDGLVYLRNSFLAYSGGYWKRLSDHADMKKTIAKFYASGATVAKVHALFGLLRLSCAVRDENFKPDNNYSCFLNGALDMTSSNLVLHSPHFHLQSGRNVKWDPNAKAPIFEKYLRDVFRDDIDRDEKIRFVLEWMGLCLIPDTSFEKFVVCVGEGGNGKSVLLKLMPELLGHDNVYSAPIERLGNRRALAELDGKLLLTSSEINESTVLDDGILKQVVSGDTVEAERKYEHPFTFTPTTRIMLATNHLPKLRDVTHAFFRRLVIIRFNRNFTAEEMDMNLPAKLKEELAGIFAMAVSNLRTLRERGSFILPRSSREAAEQYREDSDAIKLFAEDAIMHAGDEDRGMRPASLYDLYAKWCKAYGIEKENNITLGKRLKRMGFQKTRSNGKDYWCVKITVAGKEIMAKQSARVEDIKPDNQPESSSAVGTIKPVASQVGQAVPTEEPLAA